MFDELLLLTNSGAQSAYDQMSGDFQGSVAQVGMQNATRLYSLVSGRLRPGMFGNRNRSLAVKRTDPHASSIRLAHFEDGSGQTVIRAQDGTFDQFYSPSVWNGWFLGYGSTGKVSVDNSLDYTVGGTMFGVERSLDDTSVAGAYGSYGHANIDQDDLSRTADVDNFLAGVYLHSSDGFNYATFSTALGFDTYDTSRHVQFGMINRTASGDYDGWQGSAYLERGATMKIDNVLSLQPYMALQYIYQRQDSFVETGAGALNLSVGAVDTNSLRSILGGRIAWNAMKAADGVTVIPELRAAWSHEFLDTNNSVNARFNTTGGAGFSVAGVDLGRDWALLGTGLQLLVNESLSVFGDYDAQVNDRHVSHTGSAGFEMQW